MTKIPLDTQFITNELDYFGESLTLSTVSDRSMDTWGGVSETTSNTSITAVVNVLDAEEDFVKEGRFQPGDLRIFIKPGQSVSVRDKVFRVVDSQWYEITQIHDQSPVGDVQIKQAFARKI